MTEPDNEQREFAVDLCEVKLWPELASGMAPGKWQFIAMMAPHIADAIAARDKARDARGGASAAWIPVGERLPGKNARGWDFSDDVLVAVRCDNGAEFVSKDRYDHNASGDDGWCSHRGARDGRHVTHWMPMPAPPLPDREGDEGRGAKEG